MVAYTLPSATDESAIRRGARLGLLGRPRGANATNQHAGPGARVHLNIARNRENPQRHLPTMTCVLNADVIFTKDGVRRVASADSLHGGAIEGLHALLLNAEQGSAHDRPAAVDRLARALGFTDYADLWADIAPRDATAVARTVIGWRPPA